MAEILNITRFGNPILRQIAKRLTRDEILSHDTQSLINNMRYKPTPNRPELEPFDTVLINPEIVETFGEPTSAWEGCVSCGTDDDILFAQVLRFKKVRVTWLDEYAVSHEEIIEGFVAQVVQHETDHLNGVLFVDHVQDSTSFMMADEYRKRILSK